MSDTQLISLGREFETTHAQWLRHPNGERRDDLLDRLNSLAEGIRVTPATTVEEAAIKARNLLWVFGLTHAGVPDVEVDPPRHELAAFVAELEGLTVSSNVVALRSRVAGGRTA